MGQFDVYAGIGRSNRLVVDLQSDILDPLATRIVAPLFQRDEAPILTDLTPQVRLDGQDLVVMIPLLASVPVRELQRPVGSIASDQDAVKRALDVLFLGF
ncbi:CcdB family protein [Microvirga sp. HBU67558]|uniref:CcdB family protein n=1 Tax=Microvirga TaxID=186650 RepID=UPI001B36B72B|nr:MULTISPECIES: CcdB family protein [unclassified Microvirga]MBQ0821563.1 CcdB family protein [Microvirga sp. HBU67558]